MKLKATDQARQWAKEFRGQHGRVLSASLCRVAPGTYKKFEDGDELTKSTIEGLTLVLLQHRNAAWVTNRARQLVKDEGMTMVAAWVQAFGEAGMH